MIRDSSLVRTLKIGKREITYSFVSIRSFFFKIIDLTVSVGICSLIMDMAEGLSVRSYNEWCSILIIWLIMKLYYTIISFDGMIKSINYTGERTQ